MQAESLIVYRTSSNRLDTSAEKKLNHNNVFLSDGIWRTKKMKQFCSIIRSWKTQNIWAYNNDAPFIIKDLMEVDFCKLLTISLIRNKIASIEGLNRLRMPVLQTLYVGYNDITSLSDVRKANYPQLSTLSMNQNHIKEANCLTKVEGNLGKILLEYTANDCELCSDIRWVAKLQTAKLETLWQLSSKRIKSDKFVTVMKKRFSKVDVLVAKE